MKTSGDVKLDHFTIVFGLMAVGLVETACLETGSTIRLLQTRGPHVWARVDRLAGRL